MAKMSSPRISMPSSVTYYIKKYPSTWNVYLKLIKTCKYFYSKNDPVPINGIFKSRHKPWIVSAFGHLYSYEYFDTIEKYWISSGLYLGNIDTSISKNILRKVYRSDINQLALYKHSLTFREFKILTSSKKLEIFSVLVPIKYDNGNAVTFGEVIQHLPSVKYLQYEDPVAASSPEKIVKIVEQLNNSIQSHTRWLQLGRRFCKYKKILKENPEVEYFFGFLNPNLDINAKEFYTAKIINPLYKWNYNSQHILIKHRKQTGEDWLLCQNYGRDEIDLKFYNM